MTKVINILGGPGVGKSTLAASLFGGMKAKGYSCELVQEFAKDCVWGDTTAHLANQIYVFGQQHHRMFILDGKVDYIITDSPLLLNCIYGKANPLLYDLALSEFNKWDNINILCERHTEYESGGRINTLSEAEVIDRQVVELIEYEDFNVNPTELDAEALNELILRIVCHTHR